jgi:adenylate cyclase
LSAKFEESIGLWWLFTVRGAIQSPPDPVIVAIDGTTGADLQLSKLPRDWPRTIHAQLVDRLVEEGAAVIVFDMDFSRVKGADEDAVFADAIQKADRVVLFEPLIGKKQPLQSGAGHMSGWTWVEAKLSPSPQLAAAAKALGPFPLPKLGRSAFQFWTFKPSTGNAPTIAAARAVYAMPQYDHLITALQRTGVGRPGASRSGATDAPDRCVDGVPAKPVELGSELPRTAPDCDHGYTGDGRWGPPRTRRPRRPTVRPTAI